MSFIGEPTIRKITTSNNKSFRIFISEQEGGFWISTVLYVDNHKIKAENILANKKEEAYINAVEWTINNIDKNAVIEEL